MSTQQERGFLTYARDVVLFVFGIVIIARQAGIVFPAPERVELELLAIGALFCNGPLFLSYWNARRGTPGPSVEPAPSEPGSQSAPSSGT